MKNLAVAVCIFAFAGTAAAVQRPGSPPKPPPAAPAPGPTAAPARPGGRPATAAPAQPAQPAPAAKGKKLVAKFACTQVQASGADEALAPTTARISAAQIMCKAESTDGRFLGGRAVIRTTWHKSDKGASRAVTGQELVGQPYGGDGEGPIGYGFDLAKGRDWDECASDITVPLKVTDSAGALLFEQTLVFKQTCTAAGAAPENAEPPNVVGGPSSPATFEPPTVEFAKRNTVLVAKLGVKVNFNVANSNASITVKSKCTLNGKVVKETTVLKAGNVVPGVDSVLSTELKGMTEKTKQCELEFGYGSSAKFERLGFYCWPGGQSERGIYDGPCE